MIILFLDLTSESMIRLIMEKEDQGPYEGHKHLKSEWQEENGPGVWYSVTLLA